MNIQKMMQQVQEMQSQMQKTQADLAGKIITASVAGDRVVVTANGQGDIQSITITKEVVDPNDVDMLQDLVLTAVQKVQAEVKALASAEMGKLTGGLGLPPGLGL
jgi:DNA-binding YbaB/EbfC family protein